MSKWSAEELQILYENGPHIRKEDLGRLLPERTLAQIRAQCVKRKINLTLEAKQQLRIEGAKRYDRTNIVHYQKLPDLQLNDWSTPDMQVLLGSLLGDGGIRRDPRQRHYHYVETHAVEQDGYLKWKSSMMKQLCP